MAPKFTEIEDNVVYIEKEDEFDELISSDEECMDEKLQGGLIKPLTKQQRKLAKKEIDIFSTSKMHLTKPPQRIVAQNPDQANSITQLFTSDTTQWQEEYHEPPPRLE